jgi:hypothetical protein
MGEVLERLEMPADVAVSGLEADGAGVCGRFGLYMGGKEGNPGAREHFFSHYLSDYHTNGTR